MNEYCLILVLILGGRCNCYVIIEADYRNLEDLPNFVRWYFEKYTCLTIFQDGDSEVLNFAEYGEFSLRINMNIWRHLSKINSTEGFLIFSNSTANILNYFTVIRETIDGIVERTLIITYNNDSNEYLAIFNHAYKLSFQYVLIILVDINGKSLIFAYDYFSKNVETFNLLDYQRIISWMKKANFHGAEMRSVKNFFNELDTTNFFASILGDKLNFSVSYLFTYQKEAVNKTSDILRKILKKEIDFLFSPIFVTNYCQPELKFLEVLSQDELCVIVPKSKEYKNVAVIPGCFSAPVCILLGVFVSLLWLSLYIVAKAPENRPKFDYRIQTIILDGLQIVLNVPHLLSTRKYPNRVLFMITLLFLVVLNTTFQCSLYRLLALPRQINDINTLEELAESGLVISTSSDNLKDTFAFSNKHYMKKIKLVILNRNQSKYPAYLDRSSTNTYQEVMNFKRYGDTKQHMVPECPQSYAIAHIVRKDSILADAISKINRHIVAGGLLSKWYRDSRDNISMYTPFYKKCSMPVDQKQFKINDFKFCFAILIVGFGLSTIAFIIEVVWVKYARNYLSVNQLLMKRRFTNKLLSAKANTGYTRA